MLILIDGIISLTFSLIRPLGLILFFPLFSTRILGTSLIKNGILLVLVVPIFPLVREHTVQFRSGVDYFKQLPSEIFIGIVLGFFSAIAFWAVDMAGFLIDTLRGTAMGSVYNPMISIQTSLFGLLFSQFLCALFFLGDGIHHLLTTLYESYFVFPIGATLALDHKLFDLVLMQWQLLYHLCLSFSLPAILAMILLDLAIGLINRAVSQLNVFFLSMSLKSVLVLFILLLSLPYAIKCYFQLQESKMVHSFLSKVDFLKNE